MAAHSVITHRIRKLVHKLKHEGLRSAGSFLLHDLYFRAVSAVAFPLGRRRAFRGGGRDLFGEFVTEMQRIRAGQVLEIGSRAVSDVTVRNRFPSSVSYIGMDVHAGPNVDVVGDAHALSTLFEQERFDGIFSLSVFEHLLMPWVVVLEINKVLKPGGLVIVHTHPTWPPHELPWDFWRFQENAFWALFNQATGFEIVCTVLTTPARIFPHQRASHLLGTTKTVAPMGVTVLARKIGKSDPRLSWPLTAAEITPTRYPTIGAKGAA
jgi:SAM-dependent methyltransferase